eukprot:scaffold82665_cov33-Prasinocladus_malaysianus.AAC.1
MPLKQDAAPSCANIDALSYPLILPVSSRLTASFDISACGNPVGLQDEVATMVGQGTEVTSCTACEYGSAIGACYSITAPMGSYDDVLDGWKGAEETYEGFTCEDMALEILSDDFAGAVGTAMAIGTGVLVAIIVIPIILIAIGVGLCIWCCCIKKNQTNVTIVGGQQPMHASDGK